MEPEAIWYGLVQALNEFDMNTIVSYVDRDAKFLARDEQLCANPPCNAFSWLVAYSTVSQALEQKMFITESRVSNGVVNGTLEITSPAISSLGVRRIKLDFEIAFSGNRVSSIAINPDRTDDWTNEVLAGRQIAIPPFVTPMGRGRTVHVSIADSTTVPPSSSPLAQLPVQQSPTAFINLHISYRDITILSALLVCACLVAVLALVALHYRRRLALRTLSRSACRATRM